MTALTAINNGQYVDLLIVDDDIAIGDDGCPAYIDGRASIAQDILHLMRESGLLLSLIGQRDAEVRQSVLVQLVQLIEDDLRIIPGTAKITESNPEKYWIMAKTAEYHELGFWL